MLKYYRDLLTEALAGDEEKYRQFKLDFASPKAPTPQQIADFFFIEHTWAEFINAAVFNQTMKQDVIDWHQSKAFTIAEPINASLGHLANVIRTVSIDNLDERVAKLTEIINLSGVDNLVKAIAYNIRGNAYDEKGEYERAIQDFDQAIRLKPDYAIAYCNRGTAYAKKGQYDRAIQDYNQAIKLKLDDAIVYYNRGNAYLKQGQIEKATSDFLDTYRLAPANSALQKNAKDTVLRLTIAPKQVTNSEQTLALPPINTGYSMPLSSSSSVSSVGAPIPSIAMTPGHNRNSAANNGIAANPYLGQVTRAKNPKKRSASVMEVDEKRSTPAPSGLDVLSNASIKVEGADEKEHEKKRPRRK